MNKCANKSFGVLVTLSLLTMPALAQTPASAAGTKLTIKDAKEINYQASETLKQLQVLMIAIADPSTTATDFKDFFEGSIDPTGATRIFKSKTIIVEDDVDPTAVLGSAKDLTVDKYLNTFDTQYGKSTGTPVDFSNVVISPVKMKDYLYLNIKFDSKFSNTNAVTKATYPLRQRQATLRIENTDNKWKALIESITFFDPAKPIDGADGNVDIYTDTSATATIIAREDFDKEVGSFMSVKMAEEKNKQVMYDATLELANTLIANKQYPEALEQLAKARQLKTFAPQLDKLIYETKAKAAEYTYEKFKNRGDKLKSERRYKAAYAEYQVALKLNPGASSIVNPIMAEINSQLTLISPAHSKLAAGQYDQAIADCKAILTAKENKKTPERFPELFYIQAQAYEGLIEQKPDDARNNTEKAMDNYKLALQYFPVYLDARISRAAFIVKYKTDHTTAIADYDILVLNALDEAPEKPGYLVTRAKFKDKLGNTGGAIEDYNLAIGLNANNPTIFFDRGELQYRLLKHADAQLSLDAAVKLDPKYKSALYYRGLNNTELKNYDSAGADFAATAKLNFEPAQSRKVDSISNQFFLAGERSLAQGDLVNADTAYNNAIKIKKGNAQAWHGKAEIRLLKALALAKIVDKANPLYQESIDLNNTAIGYDVNFSDAHYKAGLAFNNIATYDKAISYYSEAIRSDSQNHLAYTQRGNTFQTTKKFDKAADDYVQAINILKANWEAAKKASQDTLVKYTLLNISAVQQLDGQALYYNNDMPGSLLVLDQAIDNNNANAEAYYYRGLARIQQKDFSKAFKDFNAAIKVKPEYKYFYANASGNYIYKNYEQAVANYNEGMRYDSLKTLANRNYLRGLCYFKLKNIDSTLVDFAAYEKAGVLASDTSFYADHGLAKLYAGQDSSGITYLEKALTVKSNNAKALYSLGCAYAKAGKFEKSLEYMQKAFATHELVKDDISLAEKTFVSNGPLWKDKPSKNTYNQLKAQAGF